MSSPDTHFRQEVDVQRVNQITSLQVLHNVVLSLIDTLCFCVTVHS